MEAALIHDPKGYYAVLDIQPNASPALIRAAYRVRAMELHPDRNDSLSSTPDFQRLQEAFDVLGDPARKAAYDAWAVRAAATRRVTPAHAPRPEPVPRGSTRFALPAGAAIVVLFAVAFWFWLDGEPDRPEPQRRVATAQARPVDSTDPVRLLANAMPLPTSGILQLKLPSEAFANAEQLPRLKLVAPRDASYLVKLSAWDSNAEAMSVFIRAGDTTEVLVPIGRYRIRLASGVQWYGEALRFGPTTQYSQVDTMSEFQPFNERPVHHELLLARYAGVDTGSTQISASSF